MVTVRTRARAVTGAAAIALFVVGIGAAATRPARPASSLPPGVAVSSVLSTPSMAAPTVTNPTPEAAPPSPAEAARPAPP
ncbi:MAG: hypothetical protein ACRD0N_10540, partial [Acidimicrobiales bacterium]